MTALDDSLATGQSCQHPGGALIQIDGHHAQDDGNDQDEQQKRIGADIDLIHVVSFPFAYLMVTQ